jgi:branched-chain amino acid transport system permease protein
MRVVQLRQDRASGRASLLIGVAGPVFVAGLATLLAGGVQILTNGGIYDIVLLFGINAIMVVGYQVFVGNAGIVSFGHVAFMGLGAYAAGIVSVPSTLKSTVLPTVPHFLAHTQFGMLPSLLIGGVTAAVFALVAGSAILRLSGAAASIATLGLLIIVNNLLSNAAAFTNGPQSFFGVPDTTNFAWVFVSLIVVVALSAWLKWSPLGLRARAVRENTVAAESSGVRRVRSRLWPFILSAFITGIGGALYAHDLTAFSPASFYVPQIVGILAMAILGGLNSISGALTGAALISFLNEGLRRLETGVTIGPVHIGPAVGISQAVLGVVLIAMLRWRPAGLLGALELEIDPRRPPRARDVDGGETLSGALNVKDASTPTGDLPGRAP